MRSQFSTDRYERARPVGEVAVLDAMSGELAAASDTPFTGTPHRILSYFTGEVPIHAAAMLLDPGANLEIAYDPVYYLDEYRAAAEAEGLAGPEDYARFLGEQPPGTGEDGDRTEIVRYFAAKGQQSAQRMKAEAVSLGIHESRIRLIYCDDIQQLPGSQRQVSATHKLVADRFLADPVAARDIIREGVFGTLSTTRKEKLDKIVDSVGLPAGVATFLLWVRRSSLAAGGAYPELDMPDVFLEQIADALRERFGGAAVLLVGDDPGPGLRAQRADLFRDGDLTRFWERYGLTPRNRAEQVYFLLRLAERHGAVAIGMESGAIEMPALVGVPTVYLERRAMRSGKAERWTYVSGARFGDPASGPAQSSPGPVPTWRRQQFEAPTEWLFPIERLARIVRRYGESSDEGLHPQLAQAAETTINRWHATVTEYDEELTSSVDGAPDWITVSRTLRALLWNTLGLLNPDYRLGDEDRPAEPPSPADRMELLTVLVQHLAGPPPSGEETDQYNLVRSIRLDPRELHRLEQQILGFAKPGAAVGRSDLAKLSELDRQEEREHGVPWNWRPSGEAPGFKIFVLEPDPVVESNQDVEAAQKLIASAGVFIDKIKGLKRENVAAALLGFATRIQGAQGALLAWVSRLESSYRAGHEDVREQIELLRYVVRTLETLDMRLRQAASAQ